MKRTHGLSTTKAYSIWYHMKRRCNDPSHQPFKYYGAKGIKVCDRWQSFENFLGDMGDPPPGMSIDRIDNTKGYSPENCRWADLKTQANNRGNNRFITYNGVTKTIAGWVAELGIPRRTIISRISRGFPVEKVLSTEKFADFLSAVQRSAELSRAKTHCKFGHPLSGDNLHIIKTKNGIQRRCKECNRIRAREWYRKNLAKK